MDERTVARYRYYRAHGMNARHALGAVRWETERAEVLGVFGDWNIEDASYAGFATKDRQLGDLIVRVGIGDDDRGTDWGDIEPSDAEREATRSFYVFVQVLDGDEHELYHDGIGGVDVIDLPGYVDRTWEDAAAYALSEYLLVGAVAFADNENAERAEWEARDVVTVA